MDTKGQRRRIGAEIIACVMKSPRTRQQILEMVPCSSRALQNWMNEFRASGLVYCSQRKPDVYHLQTTPFGNPDVPLARQRRRKEKPCPSSPESVSSSSASASA